MNTSRIKEEQLLLFFVILQEKQHMFEKLNLVPLTVEKSAPLFVRIDSSCIYFSIVSSSKLIICSFFGVKGWI